MDDVVSLNGPDQTSAATVTAADELITRLRRELEASEARFGALAEAMPHIFWATLSDGKPDYFNAHWYAYTGSPADGPDAQDWTAFIHPDDRANACAQWRRGIDGAEPFSIEQRLREGRSGAWRWFLVRASPMRDVGGNITRWFAACTDVDEVVRARDVIADRGAELERLADERTAALVEANIRLAAAAVERRDTEAARRGVDALYAAYIDSTTDGVFVVCIAPDRTMVVETVNRVVERALGVRRADVPDLDFAEVLPAETAERLAENLSLSVASLTSVRYEEAVEIAGVERVYEVTLTPVPSDDRMVRIVGAARDLTERRRAEEQLRQAQKMEVVGQLTGGVAHDFNNLLQVVKGNLELLALDLSGASGLPATVERRLRDAMAGAERGAKLTRQLLAFSRRQPLAPKRVDVYGLIASMSEMLERSLGETVEVSIAGDEPSWTALVDPVQLESAVLNLAINARDAMPGGGRLSISVRNEREKLHGEEWIVICVADTGAGMSAAVLARVYEPFFSTKPEGRGTGLGLPQVQGFIEQSNGRMEIESAPSVGTTVKLYLPGGDDPADHAETHAPENIRGRGERIMVLEDDEAVRRAVADLLTTLGYRVTSAGSTREAAERIADGAAFDLLLSDVVMPGSPSPPELARALQAERPDLKVLFMSGYAEDVVVHQGRIDADVSLIQKPYRKDELSLRLRQMLEPPAAARPLVEDAAEGDAPVRARRILLVEDEPLIAMGLSELLASFGYDVAEAKTASEAQQAFAAEPPIDVVLTDLGLPDMDGEDLALWLREQRPGVPIVFSTGQSNYAPPPSIADSGRTRVVTKPFNSVTLREALDAAQT